MRLVFDDRALADLEHIFDWIAQDSPPTARAVIDRVFSSIEHLAAFPQMGRPGRDEGTREWVVPRLPSIVVYEVDPEREQLLVIAVFHGAQDREGAASQPRSPG
ncbi:type II toxin-antitoxin system RelE/ParE family toxin [Rhodoplanes azumiensis]|uniref:Type II toxin-antitoxin system RelE/ParE family toxin n=1 Tax=Rhodoplanes azumiensis TaxID=1897628 RepID=A0ABW5AKI1_9BRAD